MKDGEFLAAVGSVPAKDRTEFISRLRLPPANAVNSAFISRVRELLALAETQRELLVQVGMNADLLEKLAKMVEEFEATLESVRAARLDHIGARADLEDITDEQCAFRPRGEGGDPAFLRECSGLAGRPAHVFPSEKQNGDEYR
jgi:hypothetical protein